MTYKQQQIRIQIPDIPITNIKYPKNIATKFSNSSILSKYSELSIYHTPPERLPGSVQCPRPMTFTQLFFGISGTQNRKNQNFLTSPFFVIEILRYPTFPYCFYYIAILQLGHFRDIFTKCLASSDRMYLENYNFLRFSLTSIGISW